MEIDRECCFESRLVVGSLVTRQASLHNPKSRFTTLTISKLIVLFRSDKRMQIAAPQLLFGKNK